MNTRVKRNLTKLREMMGFREGEPYWQDENTKSDSSDDYEERQYKVQVNFSVPEARRITLYRDDSTTQVVYENVKHIFWLADNSVLCIAQYDGKGEHHYINWPRERFAWYKDEKVSDC